MSSADDICPEDTRCSLEAVRTVNCTCFASPLEHGETPIAKNSLMITLTIFSTIFSFYLIIPYSRIPAKKKFPSNMTWHMLVTCVWMHFVQLLSSFTSPKAYSVYNIETDETVTNNLDDFQCALQAFSMYWVPLSVNAQVVLVSINLYLIICKEVPASKITATSSKQIAFCYLYTIICCLLPQVFAQKGFYSLYCSIVNPMWPRLFMYIPMCYQGFSATLLMYLVWRRLHAQNAKVLSGDSGSKSSSAAGGIPNNVIRRMLILGVVMGLASGGAAIPRILQSVGVATYFESKGAGKVGSTEYMACTFGFIVSLAFVYDNSVFLWWRGKEQLGTSTSSQASSTQASSTSEA